MAMIRGGQRMYAPTVEATDSFYVPSSEETMSLFGSGLSRGRASSSSSGSSEDKDSKYMYRHALELSREKSMIGQEQKALEQYAYDALMNKYNGDIDAFQREELEKFKNNDKNGFYYRMSELRRSNNTYQANKIAAGMERKRWDDLVQKTINDEALDMVIEDERGLALRTGPNGMLYRYEVDPESGDGFYRGNDGSIVPMSEAQRLGYYTQEAYLQNTFYNQGYRNGVAMGPSQYYNTYKMSEGYFRKQMDTQFSAAAAAGLDTSRGWFDFGTLGEVSPDEEGSLVSHWRVLKNYTSRDKSNIGALKIAINGIYNALDEYGKRDARQEYYKAQQSGKAFLRPGEDPESRNGYEYGQGLSFETFLYNRAMAVAGPRQTVIDDFTQSFDTLNSLNKDSGNADAQKQTRLQVLFNPLTAMNQGAPSKFQIFEPTGEINKEGESVYRKMEIDNHVLTIDDPMTLRELNKPFVNESYSESDYTNRYVFPVENVIPKNVLTLNGQVINIHGLDARFKGYTGRIITGPQMGRDAAGNMAEMATGYDRETGTTSVHESYAEVSLYVPHNRELKRRFEIMQGDGEEYTKAGKGTNKSMEDSSEAESSLVGWFGGVHGYDTKTIKVLIPVGIAAQLSGEGFRTETVGNSYLAGQMLHAEEQKRIAEEIISRKSTPNE